MLSRRNELVRPTYFRTTMQFTRHTLMLRGNKYEFSVKVFNRTVENFVEKARPQFKTPRQNWALS
jgi:hypothetical protein